MSTASDRVIRFVDTDALRIAYEQHGRDDAFPVVLVHGFPYDPRAFDDVAAILTDAQPHAQFRAHFRTHFRTHFRVIVPYVRGFGSTRLISESTMRSGQQGAVGHDLVSLLDALKIDQAVLAGFDWGARAACVVAALWPERVRGLVTASGYQIQNIAKATQPAKPEDEHRYWYQYYFNTERGRNGLRQNRHAFCKLLWSLWSPTWKFDDPTYDATAASFDNPDFVDVSIHSYRHRHGNAEGDPRYAEIEERLAHRPPIMVPSIAIHGDADEVNPLHVSEGHERLFAKRYERRLFAGIGHNLPQEAPGEFARAVSDVFDWGR